MMGRPQDKFSWENVEKVSDSEWRCKHCKGEFSGSANRIRIHLSGEGFGIRSCEAVPSHIREEALLNKGADSKRARYSEDSDPNVTNSTMINNSSDDTVTASTTSNDTSVLDASERLSNGHNLLSVQDTELYVTGALVKSLLLKSNNLLVDFIKDPHFRTFLERVRQYGVPASLLGDDTHIIEKSLMSYKEEVRRYMSEVKEYWKITGCTMMVYSLNQRKGKLSDLDKGNYVLGFYSPKGFIFFENLSIDRRRTSPELVVPSDVECFIYHDDDDSCCELVDPRNTSLWCDNLEDDDAVRMNSCLRHQIQRICSIICEGSEWLKGLFNKAEQIHQHIAHSHLRNMYYEKKKELKEYQKCPPSSFVSVMLLEDDLKAWLSNPIEHEGCLLQAEIEATLNDSEFWIQGRLVQTALNLILEFADLMDTLVPSAGYLKLAFDNVMRELNSCNRPHTPMLDQFWNNLVGKLNDVQFGFTEGVTYLNPAYSSADDLTVSRKEGSTLYLCVGDNEYEVSEEEIQRYNTGSSNPFANISQEERENTHPIKLWEEHGHAFPDLQKCAMKELSQPVSCLCNQVKRHLSELKGADNLILRLNARMMEQFRDLGEDIYKPINCKPSVHW